MSGEWPRRISDASDRARELVEGSGEVASVTGANGATSALATAEA